MTLPGPEALVLATKIQIQESATEERSSEATVEGGLLRQEQSPNRNQMRLTKPSCCISFRSRSEVSAPCPPYNSVPQERHHDNGDGSHLCERKHSGKHRLDNCARLCRRSVDALELA